MSNTNKHQHIADDKTFRRDLDDILQRIKDASNPKLAESRTSRERSIAVTKIQEAVMWLGMDLKAINEEAPGSAPNPYPESYNPASAKIEPTADGLKL